MNRECRCVPPPKKKNVQKKKLSMAKGTKYWPHVQFCRCTKSPS